MNEHKKVLVVYATAGSGHKKAAEAILQETKKTYPEAQGIDMVDLMSPLMARIYRDGYIFLITRMPLLWGILYFLSDTPALKFLNVHFRKFTNRLSCGRFIDLLVKEKPDCIISTHFTASELVSYTKAKLGLKIKLITVVTDYGVHNFWLNSGTDLYCCASEMTREILIKKGIPEPRIKITGIPISEKFLKVADKKEMMEEFGLNRDLFTALIITGGIGAGPIEETIELLKHDAQILVVCGYNTALLKKLEEKKYPYVRTFGFVEYVQKLMRACDVVITKAGGLTISESLAMERPMVFFYLIPGQERINAETIASEKAGRITQTPKQIKEAVLDFKNDPVKLSLFSQKARALSKPSSAREIVSFIG